MDTGQSPPGIIEPPCAAQYLGTCAIQVSGIITFPPLAQSEAFLREDLIRCNDGVGIAKPKAQSLNAAGPGTIRLSTFLFCRPRSFVFRLIFRRQSHPSRPQHILLYLTGIFASTRTQRTDSTDYSYFILRSFRPWVTQHLLFNCVPSTRQSPPAIQLITRIYGLRALVLRVGKRLVGGSAWRKENRH